jgi:type III restriction enzyme
MQLKFEANQEYQLAAIDAVADLFEGQAKLNREMNFSLGHTAFAAIANRLDLDEGTLLANLQQIQARSEINGTDAELKCIEGEIESATGMKKVRFPNFSVEMETGTGKTYVYIRTALDLFRRYGFRKYIVVVPSIAIKDTGDYPLAPA